MLLLSILVPHILPLKTAKKEHKPGGQPCRFLGIARGSTTTSRRGFCLSGGRSPWGFLKLLRSWAGAHTGNTKSSAGPHEPATPPLWSSRLRGDKGSQSINQDSGLRHLFPPSLPRGALIVPLLHDDRDKSRKTDCGRMWQSINHPC